MNVRVHATQLSIPVAPLRIAIQKGFADGIVTQICDTCELSRIISRHYPITLNIDRTVMRCELQAIWYFSPPCSQLWVRKNDKQITLAFTDALFGGAHATPPTPLSLSTNRHVFNQFLSVIFLNLQKYTNLNWSIVIIHAKGILIPSQWIKNTNLYMEQ